MQSKSFLLAVAAVAVTATGIYSSVGIKALERARLSRDQVSAFEVARELRDDGKFAEARDVLYAAGIDEMTLVTLQSLIASVPDQDLSREIDALKLQAYRVAMQSNDYETALAILDEIDFS